MMMLQKWDSTSAEVLKQQIKAAVDPIVARHEHYKTATANMLLSITNHFFNETNKDKILEVTHYVAGNVEQEPVMNQFLQKKFDNLVQFTQTIQECGLGLGLEQDGDYFVFNYSEGLKPETVEFMNKLAIALSACRICIGMEQIYRTLLQDPHVQTQEYEDFLVEVRDLAQKYYAGPVPDGDYSKYLRAYYQSALSIQNRLKEQHIKVNAWKEPFADQLQKALAVICQAIKCTGLKLIESTTAFPDKTWLGDGWSPFVIGLLSELVARYYSYTYVIAGSLSLNQDYFFVLTTELSTFSLTMQDQMEHLKLAILKNADVELGDLIRNIQGQAAVHQIVLVPEEKPAYYGSGNLYLLYPNPNSFQEKRGDSYVQNVRSDYGLQ
ncbi:hypothetical protein [Legionella quateirensis]|nr:hypothetical protein [Legionella quateirensis]